jgi:hypothetical protein
LDPPHEVTFTGSPVTLRYECVEEAELDTTWKTDAGLVFAAAALGIFFGSPWGFGMQLWLAIVTGLDAYWQIERQKR